MRTKNIKYCLVALTLLLSSCDKWLTVNPEYQIVDSDLYGNPEGFYNSINGVYIDMASTALYGSNLSWCEIDAWARMYTLYTSNHETSIALKDLKYDEKSTISFAKTIWETGYSVISQTNDILANVEKKEEGFFYRGLAEKNLIRGEALAIRGMMHFDLARIFADAPVISADKPSIPYVDTYPSIFNPPIALNELLTRIIADLEQAQGYLRTFDLGTSTDSTNLFMAPFRLTSVQSKFYGNRGMRLNYLATTVLLARVNLYAGNYKEAYKYAKTIIDYVDKKALTVAASSSLSANPMSYDDLLFAFYNKKAVESYSNTINLADIKKAYAIADPKLYSYSSSDKRSGFLMAIPNVQNVNISSRYYNKSEADLKNCLLPNMRISEAYYIAAEALTHPEVGTVAEAVTLLKAMRKFRGVSTNFTEAQFDAVLSQEYRREFLGEGQILFYFKRRNMPIIYETETTTLGLGSKSFTHNGKLTLTIPDSESGI